MQAAVRLRAAMDYMDKYGLYGQNTCRLKNAALFANNRPNLRNYFVQKILSEFCYIFKSNILCVFFARAVKNIMTFGIEVFYIAETRIGK